MNGTTIRQQFGDYTFKILNGLAAAIVIGLIANAILGELFKYLYASTSMSIFFYLWQIVFAIQFLVPILAGVLTGLGCGYTGLQAACLGAATFIASGVIRFTPATAGTIGAGTWSLHGIGDLFNVILIAYVAIIFINYLKSRLGSLTIIFLPILGGAVPGLIGLFTLPYMQEITVFLGDIINTFTTLQKYIMCMLICMSFSIIIITPVSTVVVGIATGLMGFAAGAAALGVASTALVVFIGSIIAKNEKGVSLAIILGAIKLMMPNLVKYPILALPVLTTSAITGLIGAYLSIGGTPTTAGFGFIGLVGPIAAFNGTEDVFIAGDSMYKVAIIGIAFFVVPLVLALISDIVYRKILKIYDEKIFINTGGSM